MQKGIDLFEEIEGIERFLNLPVGTLRNIPVYARVAVIEAIRKVQDLEKHSLFRPGLYYIVLADLCGNTAFNAKYTAQGPI